MNLLAVSLCLAAVATIKASSSENHHWVPPAATDVLSPCPGLNTLANHGYLPRDGKNISIPMILQAAIDGFNVGPDAIIQAAKFGLLSGNTPIMLDLDALKLHNLAEHDASISRGDLAVTGDNLHFNEIIFTNLANANPGVDYCNASSAAHVQDERRAISLRTNPNITDAAKEVDLRTRESALYLSVMGNPITGVAPKNFVQIFFREECLPIAEGWERSNMTITAESLNPIQNQIFFVSNYTGPTQPCEALVLGPDLTI
ncbi:Chloroperoxidase [Mycena galopus ATCC 62051]|nr:Chloroperoxidase [Mycena galopus ATCC 62051]